MVSQKTEIVLQLADDCRIRASCKEAFLKWYAKVEKAKGRRPAWAELVHEMRRKSSPLRGMVEQGQAGAAEAYWKERAQYFLRHIEVVRVNVVTKEVLAGPVRAYVPLRKLQDGSFGEGSYVPTGRRMSKEDRFSIVEQAHADLEAWLARFGRYAEFLDEFEPVVKAYRKVKAKVKRQTR